MKKFIYLFIGGILGAITRSIFFKLYILNSLGNFPLNTLIVNLLGCFLLSLAVHLAEKHISLNEDLHLAMTTGFLGSFTTFSTFSADATKLIHSSNISAFLIYIFISLVGGFSCVYAGYNLAKKGRC